MKSLTTRNPFRDSSLRAANSTPEWSNHLPSCPIPETRKLRCLATAGQRTLYGAAIFRVLVPRSVGLDVFADEPRAFHAAIRGWPYDDTDPEAVKARRKDLANQIAEQVETFVRP